MMKSNRDRGRPLAGVQIAFERDARATRPVFSQAFHERLMDRIASEAASSPYAKPLRPSAMPSSVGRILARAGGGVVALIVASWAVVWLADLPRGGPDTGDGTTGSVPLAAASQPRGADGLLTIETMPLYDDLDSGLRVSVWMLAESLVELPDWANLAGFDAAATPSRP